MSENISGYKGPVEQEGRRRTLLRKEASQKEAINNLFNLIVSIYQVNFSNGDGGFKEQIIRCYDGERMLGKFSYGFNEEEKLVFSYKSEEGAILKQDFILDGDALHNKKEIKIISEGTTVEAITNCLNLFFTQEGEKRKGPYGYYAEIFTERIYYGEPFLE